MNLLPSHEIAKQGNGLLGLNVRVMLANHNVLITQGLCDFGVNRSYWDFTICLHRRGEGRAPFSTLQSPGFE